jgi:hypothetical protein
MVKRAQVFESVKSLADAKKRRSVDFRGGHLMKYGERGYSQEAAKVHDGFPFKVPANPVLIARQESSLIST